MRLVNTLTVGVAFAAATSSQAAFNLQIDINSVTIDSGGAAVDPNTFTGSLQFSANANTNLAAISFENDLQTVTASLVSLSGVVNYTDGAPTSGSFFVGLSDGSSYMADVDTRFSSLVSFTTGIGGTASTNLGNFGGLVGGSLFGGADVTPWNFGDAEGSVFFSGFEPDSSGVDTNANLDIFVNIPAPGLGAFGLAGLGLALRRRRSV